MSRVNIQFPQQVPDFVSSIKVRVTDINYGNHLANDSLVSFLHQARVEFFSSLGYTEFNVEGVSLIQADLMVRYRQEAFMGDVLKIEVYVCEFSQNGFDMLYKLSCNRGQEDISIAEAKVGLVCFDYEAKKVINVPELFKQKFKIN